MFKNIIDYIIYNLLGLEGKFADTLFFFSYESIKILFLILLVVFVISFLRTFLSSEKINKFLSKGKFGLSNFVASIFGAVTPFCSCSSIPLFIGFIKGGIPTGVAFSFLITSPMVNEIVLVLMFGTFGWKIAVTYALFGILMGTVFGVVLGKMNMDKQVLIDKFEGRGTDSYVPKTWQKKLNYAWKESLKTFKKLFWFVLLGMAIGAIINGYVPPEFFEKFVGNFGIFSVPLAVLVGIPIYAGCSTLVPIVYAIAVKGIPLGTALAFMMSIAGLSLPEAIILKRVMSMKLLAIYFGVVTIGIVVIGLLFNLLM